MFCRFVKQQILHITYYISKKGSDFSNQHIFFKQCGAEFVILCSCHIHSYHENKLALMKIGSDWERQREEMKRVGEGNRNKS